MASWCGIANEGKQDLKDMQELIYIYIYDILYICHIYIYTYYVYMTYNVHSTMDDKCGHIN